MIKTFYKPEMAPIERVGFSQSPQKPTAMMDWLQKNNLMKYFTIEDTWHPFEKEDFLLAHSSKYVNNFFAGIAPDASSNGLNWNSDFAESVRFTNASLYHAIKYSILNQDVSFSPTSGFHHATPNSGRGFCSFSGQVIASIKIWNEHRIAGAYIDLDGHFGNSIEDSKDFVPEIKKAIRANINPSGSHEKYIKDFKNQFENVIELIRKNEIGYIVLCSGADSLVDDDLGGQVTIDEWISIKNYLYTRLAEFDRSNCKFPTTISLFGGYRSDDYNSVLDAHTLDLVSCMQYRFGIEAEYKSVYKIKMS
jgi:acetoin utilization deacetylase AcuC-like enzyme